MTNALTAEFTRSASVMSWAFIGFLAMTMGCQFDRSGLPLDEPGGMDGGTRDAALLDSAPEQIDAPPVAFDAAVPDALYIPTLTFQRSLDTPQQGGNGGTLYEDACPAGQVLIGITGANSTAENIVGQISAHCSNITLTPAVGGSYDIEFSAGQQFPGRGNGGGTPWTRLCASGEVMVGFDGRSGSLLDRLFVRCATFTVSGDLGSLVFSTGVPYELQFVGGGGGGTFPERDCPVGEVATVTRTRAGDLIDSFGLGCAMPLAN